MRTSAYWSCNATFFNKSRSIRSSLTTLKENYIGGLFGFNYESVVIVANIFFNNYDISINATNYVGGFVGYTETEDFYYWHTRGHHRLPRCRESAAIDNVGSPSG